MKRKYSLYVVILLVSMVFSCGYVRNDVWTAASADVEADEKTTDESSPAGSTDSTTSTVINPTTTSTTTAAVPSVPASTPVTPVVDLDVITSGGSILYSGKTVLVDNPTVVGSNNVVSFVLKNNSAATADLQLSNVTSSLPVFTVSGTTSALLKPGESVNLDITFLPSANGIFNAVISVISNDPNDPTFTFNVKAQAFSGYRYVTSAGAGSTDGSDIANAAGMSNFVTMYNNIIDADIAILMSGEVYAFTSNIVLNNSKNPSIYGGYDPVTFARNTAIYKTVLTSSANNFMQFGNTTNNITRQTIFDSITVRGLDNSGSSENVVLRITNGAAPVISNCRIEVGGSDILSVGIYIGSSYPLITGTTIAPSSSATNKNTITFVDITGPYTAPLVVPLEIVNCIIGNSGDTWAQSSKAINIYSVTTLSNIQTFNFINNTINLGTVTNGSSIGINAAANSSLPAILNVNINGNTINSGNISGSGFNSNGVRFNINDANLIVKVLNNNITAGNVTMNSESCGIYINDTEVVVGGSVYNGNVIIAGDGGNSKGISVIATSAPKPVEISFNKKISGVGGPNTNSSYGIEVNGDIPLDIYNNIIYGGHAGAGSDAYGITMGGNPNLLLNIINNTIDGGSSNSHAYAIYLNSANPKVANNILTFSNATTTNRFGVCEISNDISDPIAFMNNCIWNTSILYRYANSPSGGDYTDIDSLNTGSYVTDDSANTSNNVSVDPVFVSVPTDLRLSDGSPSVVKYGGMTRDYASSTYPAIWSTAWNAGILKDHFNTTRTDQWSIGAHEKE